MALNASDVSAGDDILASHQNLIIDDMEQHTHEGTDTTKVKAENLDVSTGGAPKIADAVTFVSTVTRYYSITPSDFEGAGSGTANRVNADIGLTSIRNLVGAETNLLAPIHLPNGAIITSVKTYWYNDDGASASNHDLYRYSTIGGNTAMAATAHSGSGGNHSVEDTSISVATIDNINYSYFIHLIVNSNDNINDIKFYMTVITYTITVPLP